MPRLEDERLVRGAGQFTDDWTLPEQCYAAFVRSPHAHARLQAIRSQSAARAPGVLAVLTGADYLADGRLPIAHGPVPADAVDYTRPAFGMFAGRAPLDEPQPPLAIERVRYPGEAVAVVIAESQSAARDAASLVEVDYSILPALFDPLDAFKPDAPLISPGAPDNVGVDASFGDFVQATR